MCLTAEYELHKPGRNVTGFTFRFKSKTKVISSDQKQTQLTPKNIEAYSSKLARLSGLRSESSPTGASYDEYARLIVADSKTSEGFKEIPT